MVRQGDRINHELIDGGGFKSGSSSSEISYDERKNGGRFFFQKLKNGFPKCIGSNESAVKVDADRGLMVVRGWSHSQWINSSLFIE
jgi:hypothetical protein